MENKHKVYNLIILDESGSMQSIKKTIINGFNEVLQTIKAVAIKFPEQEHYITMITFNSMGIKTIHENINVEAVNQIDERSYTPNSGTPLFDAMGFGITKLRILTENEKEYNVLVTILTDGAENASKEYNGKSIKALVDEFKLKNWTFTYIGANHDVERFADSLSINNVMRFETEEEDIQRMFMQERNSRMMYSQKIRNNENTMNGYFDNDDYSKENTDGEKVTDEKNVTEKKSLWEKIFGK